MVNLVVDGALFVLYRNIDKIICTHILKIPMQFMKFLSITLKVRSPLCSECTQHNWACVFKINNSVLFSWLHSSSGC